MHKTLSIATLILLTLIVGLNYGIYNCYNSDKTTFHKNLVANFAGKFSFAFTTKEFDKESGNWEIEWILEDNYLVNNEQVVGVVVISIYPEEPENLSFRALSRLYNAYKYAKSHHTDYTSYPPNKESIVNTKSKFFRLERREFALPIMHYGYLPLSGDIDRSTINYKYKEHYVRVSNGSVWVVVGIANTILIGLFIFTFHLVFGSKISKIKNREKEIRLDKEQDLWSILERKCNPSRFLSPYNKELVDKANSIYACLLNTKKEDITSLKGIRRKIESELGVTFVDMMEVEKLKALANPSNYMKPYNPNRVSLANALYSKLQDKNIHIDDFERIKEQIENLKS